MSCLPKHLSTASLTGRRRPAKGVARPSQSGGLTPHTGDSNLPGHADAGPCRQRKDLQMSHSSRMTVGLSRLQLLASLLVVVVVLLADFAKGAGTPLPTSRVTLGAGDFAIFMTHDSPTTQIFGPNLDGHRVVRWASDGIYSGRRMYGVFGFRLVSGLPGRMYDWHTMPGDVGGWTPPCSSGVAPLAIDYCRLARAGGRRGTRELRVLGRERQLPLPDHVPVRDRESAGPVGVAVGGDHLGPARHRDEGLAQDLGRRGGQPTRRCLRHQHALGRRADGDLLGRRVLLLQVLGNEPVGDRGHPLRPHAEGGVRGRAGLLRGPRHRRAGQLDGAHRIAGLDRGAGSGVARLGFDSTPTSTAAASPPPPTNTALPIITGSAQQGSTLGASTGSWSGSPTGFAYQWKRCDTAGANCASVGGSTGQQYTLGVGDVGKRMRVTVTATNPSGSAEATSNPTGVVAAAPPPPPPPPPAALPPVNTALPVITGTPQQGRALTSSTGSWSNSPTGYAYQWRRCDNAGVELRPGVGCDGVELHAGRRGRRLDAARHRHGVQRGRLGLGHERRDRDDRPRSSATGAQDLGAPDDQREPGARGDA